MNVGLINFNKRGVREPGVPPVPPIGLEYLVDNLEEANHDVSLLDLCFVDLVERQEAIEKFVSNKDIIGITFRNLGLDNYQDTAGNFFAPNLRDVVQTVKKATTVPVVLGGQGFSIYPQRTLEFVGADYGIAGPGEIAFCDLIKNYHKHPRGTVLYGKADTGILHKRRLIDYNRYISAGGSPAVQTKNGCPFPCGFCVESHKTLRRRSIDRVIEEVRLLLDRNVEFMFIADAEFNNHLGHAEEFCDRILAEGLKFKWSAYLNTIPLTQSFVNKLKQAGCVMPCVSAVSGDDKVLDVLDTKFTSQDLRKVGEYFQEADFPYTVDLMFGAPYETLASAEQTIKLMDEIKPAFLGMNFGVRLYSNTLLGQKVLAKQVPTDGKIHGTTENNDDFYYPTFYLSDMKVKTYLEEICDSDSKYRLFGYSGFHGVNYKLAQQQNN